MERRRKILHLIGSGTMGGREKQLLMILRSQSSEPGNQVSVLIQDPTGPNYNLMASMPGVTASTLPSRSEFSPRSMIRTRSLVSQADVVFLHSPRIAFMLPLLLTAGPLIYRLSGIFMMPISRLMGKHAPAPANVVRKNESTGVGGSAVDTNCVVVDATSDGETPSKGNGSSGRIARAAGKFSVRAQRVSRWLLFRRILTRRATAVLVLSQFLKGRAMDLYGVPEEKLKMIRIGIDPAYEQTRYDAARPLAGREGYYSIGLVARLDVRKRIDRLLEAVAPLVGRNVPVRVLIAGSGDQEKKLRGITRSLGLESHVEFIGEVNNPYDVLRASDLFVLPSDNEAFSNSVLEAMFAAVPVVVFAGGCGAGEAIEHRVDGFIVNDVGELTSLIAELATDPGIGRQAGTKGKESMAGKGLTFESHSRTLNAIMNEAMGMAR
jgi:hypothetical protein